nr:ABC transporter substrate-binding protein [Oscillospiraceae bacterium]
REVSLAAPAKKIVVLTAAECEILYALGAGDTVVGKGEYCDWPAEAANVTVVNSGYQTNVEQIIALEPDLVIMNSMDQSPEDVSKLEEAGIPVAVTLATDISGVYESIGLIGTLTGKSKEADLIVKGMKKVFDDISAKPAGNGEQTVYFEVSPLQWGLWTAGKGTFMDEVAALAGLKNCFGDVDGWAEISEEQVLERNPDYIVTITMYYGEGPTPIEEILSRPGWENVTAVKNKAILNLQDNELTRPGPRLADGTVKLNDFVAEYSVLDTAA